MAGAPMRPLGKGGGTRGADAGASGVFCVGGSKLQECVTGTPVSCTAFVPGAVLQEKGPKAPAG